MLFCFINLALSLIDFVDDLENIGKFNWHETLYKYIII